MQPGDPCVTCSIAVIDEDADINGQTSYHLLNNTEGAFAFTQGTLMPVRVLDYESLNYYLLTLLVSDCGDSPHTISATIEIFLTDVSDNPPVFNATSYYVAVGEDIELGSHLLTLHAVSKDSAPLAAVQYLIVGGDPEGKFELDSDTGRLTLADYLDFETTELYSLLVQAQSGHGAGRRLKTLVAVTVEILNVNDNQPMFGRAQYNVSVLEGVGLGHTVITVSAEDLDSGNFGRVTYRMDLTASEPGVEMTFDLDPVVGIITTLVALDLEEKDKYELVVIAEDGGSPSHTAETRVIINVRDVSTSRPIFSQEMYNASIREDVAVHTTIMNITATDADSPVIEYFIESGNAENRFQLDRSSGVIEVSAALDRECTPSYTLIVVATDGQLENSVPVHIIVTDVNDELPIFTNSYISVQVSESLHTSEQLTQVTATDNDIRMNGLVTYSSDDIPPEFNLDPSSGVIILSSSLDYDIDSGRNYSFEVLATDGGDPPLSSSARVEVWVLDENDNTPVISGPAKVSVMENAKERTPVLQLMASDGDDSSNAALSFSITEDSRAAQVFAVDTSGMLYTTQPLDREVQEIYIVSVQVTDSGQDPLTSSITISVTVQDEIDYPPVFSQASYELHITMETERDTMLIMVSAVTRDNVSSDSILYTISSGANDGLFLMDESLGEIRAATTLHPDMNAGVYSMQVTAQHQHLTETVPLTVTIREEDGIPRLQSLTVYYNILHSQLETGYTSLTSLQVMADSSQTLSFDLPPSNDQQVLKYFAIGRETGDLSVDGSVTSGHYLLSVAVSSPSGTSDGEMDVFVHVVTNSTLAHAVVAIFAHIKETDFISIHLERFAQFAMDVIPCSREQVEVFGIQQSSSQADILEVAFAIRSSNFHDYMDPEAIIDRLRANQNQAWPPAVVEFGSLVCVNEPCPNLQQCRPVLQLHQYTSQAPTRRLNSTDSVYVSHPFSQSHTCTCPTGYSHEGMCGEEVDECQADPCHFGAPCTDLVNGYICDCPGLTLGTDCEVVCPSASCLPCSLSPCLHGGECTVSSVDPSSSSCHSCPWDEQYSGPHCELTTLYFPPGSYAAFSPVGFTHRTAFSLTFSTVTPNGLLFYNQHVVGSHDFIAVELVIGQIKVSVSFGDGDLLSMKTESLRLLNDGQWHTVEIYLDKQVCPSLSVLMSCHLSFSTAGGAGECK